MLLWKIDAFVELFQIAGGEQEFDVKEVSSLSWGFMF